MWSAQYERPTMNFLKKRILIKIGILGILISLLVVDVIATLPGVPGSRCMIIVTTGTIAPHTVFFTEGIVSADGNLCIPNPPIPPEDGFANLNKGLPCWTYIHNFFYSYHAECELAGY